MRVGKIFGRPRGRVFEQFSQAQTASWKKPFGGGGATSGSDFYTYVGNDPTDKMDPTGLDSWLVSRAIYVAGVYIADHEFVVVADKLGATPKAQFDYGPQSESLTHPGQLVELNATTMATKTGDVKAWNGDPNSHARFEKLNASDASVIAAGKKMDAALGTPDHPGPVGYSIEPMGNNQGNSNSAASGVANNAVQADHPGAPHVNPPSGSYTPGSEHSFNQTGKPPPPPPKCNPGVMGGCIAN